MQNWDFKLFNIHWFILPLRNQCWKVSVTFWSLKHPFITIFLCVKCFNRIFEDLLCALFNKKPVFKTKCKIGPPPPSKKKKSICGPDFETFPNIQDPLTLKSKWAEIAPTPVYLKVQKLASKVTGLRARKPQRRYI